MFSTLIVTTANVRTHMHTHTHTWMMGVDSLVCISEVNVGAFSSCVFGTVIPHTESGHFLNPLGEARHGIFQHNPVHY